MTIRKREGGKGQQCLLASLKQPFDRTRIEELLDPNLPEGVLTENITILQQQGLLEVTTVPPKKSSERATVVYHIKEPTNG
ncbi:MAG: hypothetical protein A3J37_05955 [Alphaproteobacteria bacterium RIFCSPHIGHO2_12_FULL_45_9]|nr:MAG: hypothetical protein A3B66_02475 [Alphaproteobacteria bacterium RIFCSPHIGHO2_02_FULL_46_13]OFW93660.1 MAG: hypothetical protein A3J37_05955 [Alphaproteobacteria bacterium RIFCSPHIGHO2_12_FULL_45_9]